MRVVHPNDRRVGVTYSTMVGPSAHNPTWRHVATGDAPPAKGKPLILSPTGIHCGASRGRTQPALLLSAFILVPARRSCVSRVDSPVAL